MLASVNTMSTEIRKKYELKVRAEHQRETRERIARAATELHEEKGVAQTTVAEIARRAEVSRLTVYNHFPDLESLLPACSAHYATLHPLPDFGPPLALDDPTRRVEAVLALLYGWYRETEPVFGKAFSDRHAVPELDRFLTGNIDRVQSKLADDLSGASHPVRGPAAGHRALLRLAVDFWTWSRLSREGLDDQEAAELMADVVARP
jgi:AcrR family transcriptional regulator